MGLRSVFVKFGQYLGGRADAVPPEWADQLRLLQAAILTRSLVDYAAIATRDHHAIAPQDALPPSSRRYIARTVSSELGSPIADVFSRLEPEPLSSASVAQAMAKPDCAATAR